MNKNNLIGILLIGVIFIIWSVWFTPSQEELIAERRKQDSIAMLNQATKQVNDTANLFNAGKKNTNTFTENRETKDETAGDALNRTPYSVFSNSSTGSEEFVEIQNELLKIKFSNKGGRIYSVELKDYKTYDSLPLHLFGSDSDVFALTFFMGNRLIKTGDFYFQPFWPDQHNADKKTAFVKGQEALKFAMRLYADAEDTASFNKDKYIEFLYTISPDSYKLDYTINIRGMEEIIHSNPGYVNLEWALDLRRQEKRVDRWNGPTIYYKYLNDEVDYLSETKDDEASLRQKVKWVSYKQQFFSTTLIAKDNFVNADIKSFTDNTQAEQDSRYLRSMHSVIGLPLEYNIEQNIPMSFYFGPNKYNILRKFKLDLERQIPLGWGFFLLAWINIYAVIPVFNFLGSFGWNYGIIILILTILLKIVLFPIAYKTYKSTAKMRVLKPEVDELTKKFTKKEDALKKQQATMELYKKAGVNPMAGCVPMLLQMPILFAFFRFFPSSIELRQQSFLWATDLSSYDSIWDFPGGFSIPFYGDHVSLFTLLMTVSTIIYTHMNNKMMASSSQQMPGMKTMMYLMPVMFLGIFNNYSSGLSYYYFLANIITFGQMYLIRRTIDEKKILQQIELNKKKKPIKSNFQKRLEEAARKRGARR